MTNSILHENENYTVTATGPQETPYLLVNKTTNVVEQMSASLPEIIGHAEQSNAYLKYNAWKYIDEQVKQQVEWAGLQFGDPAAAAQLGGLDTPPDGSGTSGSNLLN